MPHLKPTRFLVILSLGLLASLSMLVATCTPGAVEEPAPSRAQFHEYLMGISNNALGLMAPTAIDAPVIVDCMTDPGNCVVKDLPWLLAEFGDVRITRAVPHPEAAYIHRLVRLDATCGPAALVVNVIDESGRGIDRRAVIRYWPGAPQLPDFSDTTASQWTSHGIVGRTEGNGAVGFGLGSGDYYFPEHDSGVSSVYIADFEGPSDFLQGLGMLGGTNHCLLHSTFQRVPKDVEPPDPPTPIPPTPTPGPTVTPGPPLPNSGWDINFSIDGSITPRE